MGQQCPEKPLPARLRKSKSRLDAGQFSPWPPAPRRWLRLWAPGSTVGVQSPWRCPETQVRGRGRGSWAAGRRKGEGKGPAPTLSWEPSCPLVNRLPLPSPTPQARSGLTEPLPVGCPLSEAGAKTPPGQGPSDASAQRRELSFLVERAASLMPFRQHVMETLPRILLKMSMSVCV